MVLFELCPNNKKKKKNKKYAEDFMTCYSQVKRAILFVNLFAAKDSAAHFSNDQ